MDSLLLPMDSFCLTAYSYQFDASTKVIQPMPIKASATCSIL